MSELTLERFPFKLADIRIHLAATVLCLLVNSHLANSHLAESCLVNSHLANCNLAEKLGWLVLVSLVENVGQLTFVKNGFR